MYAREVILNLAFSIRMPDRILTRRRDIDPRLLARDGISRRAVANLELLVRKSNAFNTYFRLKVGERKK